MDNIEHWCVEGCSCDRVIWILALRNVLGLLGNICADFEFAKGYIELLYFFMTLIGPDERGSRTDGKIGIVHL